MTSALSSTIAKLPASVPIAVRPANHIDIDIDYAYLKGRGISAEHVDKIISLVRSQFNFGSPFDEFVHCGKYFSETLPIYQYSFQDSRPKSDKSICRIYIKTSKKVKNSDGSYDSDAYLITIRHGGKFQKDQIGVVKRRMIVPTTELTVPKIRVPTRYEEVMYKANNMKIPREIMDVNQFKIEEKNLGKYGVKDISGFIEAQCYFGYIGNTNKQRVAIFHGFSSNALKGKLDSGDSKSNAAGKSGPSPNAGVVVALKDES